MSIPLTTERLILRPYVEDDRARFVTILSDPVVNKFMGGASEDPFHNHRMFDRGLAIQAGQTDKHHDIWGVACLDDPATIIGHCELKVTRDTREGQLEVVYLLTPEVWKRGYGRELIQAIIDYAFGRQLCDAIIATVDPSNEPSIHILSTHGFLFVDRYRDEEGEMTDLYILQRPEPRSAKPPAGGSSTR